VSPVKPGTGWRESYLGGSQDAENKIAQVDALKFSPWNNITDDFLRPLGSMNRARLLAYKASAEFRSQTS
jgi:hypothetical protein